MAQSKIHIVYRYWSYSIRNVITSLLTRSCQNTINHSLNLRKLIYFVYLLKTSSNSKKLGLCICYKSMAVVLLITKSCCNSNFYKLMIFIKTLWCLSKLNSFLTNYRWRCLQNWNFLAILSKALEFILINLIIIYSCHKAVTSDHF